MWYEKFRLYKNYAIIGVLSVILLGFMPFLSSEVGLALVLPNTTAGWIVYITTKLIVAGSNFLILYCFVNQGKFNVRNDVRYVEAMEKLGRLSPTSKPIPKSPEQHYRQVFGKKGTTIFITSILGTMALTQSILSFDPNTFLTYLCTLIAGVIFGVIQMEAEEVFWTDGIYEYAVYMEEQEKEKENALGGDPITEYLDKAEE